MAPTDTDSWTGTELGDRLHPYRLADLADPDRRHAWLEDLAGTGVVLTTEVEPTVAGLRAVAGHIGVIQATNYGVEWEIVTTNEPFDQVDSDLPLRVHTDLPYRRLPPRVQVLLAVDTSAAGGETILVDGRRLADRVRAADPGAWHTLTTTTRSFAHIRPDRRYIGGGPVIGLDATGAIDLIRHAPDLVLPALDGDPDEADRALGVFIDAAADAELIATIRLEPGQALVFDNHRVLHGRAPVDLSVGPRRLLGCYLAGDELDSALRVSRSVSSA